MGDDIQELARLRRMRTNLELLAYLFERLGGNCKGECERPLAILPAMPEAVTCCNLYHPWDRYHNTRRLEKHLAAKINQAREPAPVSAPLGDRYPQTHTGTYIMRKLVGGEHGEVDEGKTGEVSTDDEGAEAKRRQAS